MNNRENKLNYAVLPFLFVLFLLASNKLLLANGDSVNDMLNKTPFELVESNAQGTLVNPYDPSDKMLVEAGHRVFLETGCNGCHGGTGGGGMGPPLSNQRWVYGNNPDTLFRLITLGSQELQSRGYMRKERENVRAPMPPQASGLIVIESLTTERLWKIITWIQSLHIDKK